jgi:hypothetical protein
MMTERHQLALKRVAFLRRALQQFDSRSVEPRPFALADRVVIAELPDAPPVSFDGPFDAV